MTEFLNVNGASIDVKSALQWEAIGGRTDFTDNTIQNAAVVQYAKEKGQNASPQELQNFLNELRYSQDLEKADDFNVWMKENNYDLETIQQFCEIGVLRNKIRASIDDNAVQAFYSENKQNYDVAELYSLTVETEDLAKELKTQIQDEGESFLALAYEHSIDGDTFRQGGFVGEMTRDTIRAEVEADVFAAKPGDIIGPVKDDDGYTIYMVRRIISPEFEDIKETIRDELFEETLDEIAAHASVNQVILGVKTDPIEDIDEDEDEDEE